MTMRYDAGEESAHVSLAEFAASLLLGLLSVTVPILLFIAAVALCVYVARWWIDKPRRRDHEG